MIAWLLLAEGLYVRALRVLGRRGVAVRRWQVAAWHAGIALQAIGLLSPIDALGDDLLSAHMAQHLLIADLAAPLLLVGPAQPGAGLLPPARRARPARAPHAAARGVPVPAPAARRHPGLHARPLRLARRAAVRGGRGPSARPRPPARVLHRDRHAGLVVGAGAEAPAAARRAVEDRPHRRRPDAGHDARDGVRADPDARLHRASTGAGRGAAWSRSPTSSSPAR